MKTWASAPCEGCGEQLRRKSPLPAVVLAEDGLRNSMCPKCGRHDHHPTGHAVKLTVILGGTGTKEIK